MKKIIFSCIGLLTSIAGFSQNYPNAQETDPHKMGWMQGFPPEKEKTLHASNGSFFAFPALRYSVNHMREFFPTRNVPASQTKKYKIKSKIDKNIEDIIFIPWNKSEPMTFLQGLDANYTDGIIILHKGKIVYEKYSAGLTPDGIHAAMSVSKSFTGTLASILVAEGILDPSKTVQNIYPSLQKADLQQLPFVKL